jgi:cytochrome P450
MEFITEFVKSHQILSFVLGSISLYVLYYFQLFARSAWRMRHYRGPLAIPILGNCYNPNIILSLFKFMGNLRKQYGKVFKMFLFSRAYLVVLDPAIVRRVLSDSKSFSKGVNYADLFSVVFGEGLVTSGNEKHRADKAIFGKYFIRTNIAKLLPMMNQMTLETINQFITTPLGSNNVLPLNCEKFFARLALRIFMRFSVNHDYRHDLDREKTICYLVSKGSYYMGCMIAFSIPNWSFIPIIKFLNNVRYQIWNDMKPLVEARRLKIANNTCSPEESDDCITAMIQNNMSDKDMQDHLVTLICAGHDTTAFFSSYLCLILAENPDCQDKLRLEVERQLNGRNEITGDDINEMKFLHQVMHETLRLFAIIPNLTRVAETDVVIKEANDFFIPAGTELMIPMYLLNRDPSVWENPSKFDPSRWEGKGDYTSAKDGFFPFGYGSRTCIGNMLAQLEVSVFICQLLRQFDILPEPGFKVNIVAGISLTTSNGVKVIFRKR